MTNVPKTILRNWIKQKIKSQCNYNKGLGPDEFDGNNLKGEANLISRDAQ